MFEISSTESRIYKKLQFSAIILEIWDCDLETGKNGSKSGFSRIIQESWQHWYWINYFFSLLRKNKSRKTLNTPEEKMNRDASRHFPCSRGNTEESCWPLSRNTGDAEPRVARGVARKMFGMGGWEKKTLEGEFHHRLDFYIRGSEKYSISVLGGRNSNPVLSLWKERDGHVHTW